MIKNKYYNLNKLNKKICLFADIHYDFEYDLNIFNLIIENIKLNKPDYICIPGDIVDSTDIVFDKKIDYLIKFLKDLSLICPVIIVKGNHDETRYINKKHNYCNTDDFFNKLNNINNVYYLNNTYITLDNVNFYGINLSYNYYNNKNHEDNKTFIQEFNRLKIETSENNILLCHTPVNILKDETLKQSKNINKFDIVLSGHMHNGLVFGFLDGKSNRGFVGPFYKMLPKYAKGIMKKNNTNLIVTGGVITFSIQAPKILYKINNVYPINIDYIEI